MIVPRKYKPKISAVGLFCCNKFEETSNKKVSDLSKLSKPYFKNAYGIYYSLIFNTNFKNMIYFSIYDVMISIMDAPLPTHEINECEEGRYKNIQVTKLNTFRLQTVPQHC